MSVWEGVHNDVTVSLRLNVSSKGSLFQNIFVLQQLLLSAYVGVVKRILVPCCSAIIFSWSGS